MEAVAAVCLQKLGGSGQEWMDTSNKDKRIEIPRWASSEQTTHKEKPHQWAKNDQLSILSIVADHEYEQINFGLQILPGGR